MWETFRNPSTKKYFDFQIDDISMSMDFSIGRTMAEELPFIPGYDYNKLLKADFSVEEYKEEYKKFKQKYPNLEIDSYNKVFTDEYERGKNWD